MHVDGIPKKREPPYPIKKEIDVELAAKKIFKLWQERKILGPIDIEDADGLYINPVFVKEKNYKEGKILLLINYSAPYSDSINKRILKMFTYIEYPKIIFYVQNGILVGEDGFIWVLDLQNAYYNAYTMQKYWWRFAYEFQQRVCVPITFPFGVASCCRQFQRLLDIILEALEVKFPSIFLYKGKKLSNHFLDDQCGFMFNFIGASLQFTLYTTVIYFAGFPVSPSKVQPPSKSAKLLGLFLP